MPRNRITKRVALFCAAGNSTVAGIPAGIGKKRFLKFFKARMFGSQKVNGLKMNARVVQTSFFTRFSTPPDITVRAPGRINLIGELTDYNGGFVLPAAIDKAIWFAAGRRTDRRFAFYALDLGTPVSAESQHSPLGAESYPAWQVITFQFAARPSQAAIKMVTMQGGVFGAATPI